MAGSSGSQVVRWWRGARTRIAVRRLAWGSILRRPVGSLVLRMNARLGDVGGITTMVAAGLGCGALMGASAIVVDAGQLYVERSEVQNGADAAAVAIARACAKAPATCGSQSTTAASYANRNAKDEHTKVTLICGHGTGLNPCPTDSATNLTACIGGKPSGDYVEVHTATENADGSTLLPGTFAKAMAGESGYNGTSVGACARAAAGAPASIDGAAVTMSYCAWQAVTAAGTKLWSQFPTNPPVSYEGVIYLHGTHSGAASDNCAPGNSGWQAPGGFGWLDESGPCTAKVDTSGTYGGDTGVSPSQNCAIYLQNRISNKTVMWMPVFDGVQGTGQNTVFRLRGVSGFVLTGYALPGFQTKSTLTGTYPCNGSDKCLSGYFVSGLSPTATGLSNSVPDYGVRTVALMS